MGESGKAAAWRRTRDGVLSRRAMLGALPAMAAGAMLGARSSAQSVLGLAGSDPSLPPALRDRALAALARHHSAFWSRDVIGVVDFGLPSAVPRFHLVDILSGTARTILVAHGKGSDPEHSGMLHSFSNQIGSLATSEGAYLVGERYSGIHGPSRRLIGLDPTDDNAEARAIVLHAAWYVGPEIVERQGKLGRSDGCFAVSCADIAYVLARLGRGRLLYAGRG